MKKSAFRHDVQGLRIFVVEDDALIALLIEDILADLGCTLIGLAGTLSDALSRVGEVTQNAHGAILDINLGRGEDSFPFAEALEQAGVPFVFSTGYAPDYAEERFPDAPIVPKPILPDAMAAILADFRARDRRRPPLP